MQRASTSSEIETRRIVLDGEDRRESERHPREERQFAGDQQRWPDKRASAKARAGQIAASPQWRANTIAKTAEALTTAAIETAFKSSM